MTIANFDRLPVNKKEDLLKKCCGSSAWVSKMLDVFPVNDLIDLLEYADDTWEKCERKDWIEAFWEDPIAPDTQSLTEKYAADEHSGTNLVSAQLQDSLAESIKLYVQKFGYPFIGFAFRKSEGEMLTLLLGRLNNTPESEIKVAAAEQIQIVKSRLKKIFI